MSVVITDPSVESDSRLTLLWEDEKSWKPATESTADFINGITGLTPVFVSRPNQTFIEAREHYRGAPKTSVFVQAAHHAFDQHIPFGIDPEVVWYMILHEVAIHVHLNTEACAHLFTTKPGEKQVLKVLDDSFGTLTPDWAATIPVFRDLLREKVPGGFSDDLLPSFSTDTDESRTALLITFMDVASDYFEYRGGTMCGIPAFNLGGTPEDWDKIHDGVKTIGTKFPGLARWVETLGGVTAKLKAAANGEEDLTFWRSFFKEHGGSGGPYISGWINAFFAHSPRPGTAMVRNPNYSYDNPDEPWQIPGVAQYPSEMRQTFDEAAVQAYAEQYDRAVPDVQEGVDLRYVANSYPANVSQVEFIIDADGPSGIPERNMKLISGVLGSEFVGRYLTPQIGWAVAPAA